MKLFGHEAQHLLLALQPLPVAEELDGKGVLRGKGIISLLRISLSLPTLRSAPAIQRGTLRRLQVLQPCGQRVGDEAAHLRKVGEDCLHSLALPLVGVLQAGEGLVGGGRRGPSSTRRRG